MNLEDRTLKPIFTFTNDAPIGGFQDTYARPDNYPSNLAIVMTRKSIDLLDLDGHLPWSVPYEPSYPVYPHIKVYRLEPTNRFAIQFQPDYEANKKSGWTLPTHVEWFTAGEGISKSVDLPKPPNPGFSLHWNKLLLLLLPPAIPTTVNFWFDADQIWNPWCLIPTILSAIVGLWLGRRYSFSATAQIGWGVFHLVFGLPGCWSS